MFTSLMFVNEWVKVPSLFSGAKSALLVQFRGHDFNRNYDMVH